MTGANPYQSGGTLRGGSYIVREADERLQKAILDNRSFPYFLAARQSGKSSILARTQSILESPNLQIVIVDLSALEPVSLGSYEQFVIAFVSEVLNQIGIDDRLCTRIKRARKKSLFLLESIKILLAHISGRLVICIDEIDILKRCDFKDNFLGQIRAIFNRRGSEPTLSRIQFVLAGATSSDDLITDLRQSPFNVGEDIKLDDLSSDGMKQLLLLGWLPETPQINEAMQMLAYWTSGSVFLCQDILHRAYEEFFERPNSGVLSWVIERSVANVIKESGRTIHFRNIERILNADISLLNEWRDWTEGRVPNKGIINDLSIIGICRQDAPFRNRLYQFVFGHRGPLTLLESAPPKFAYDVFLSSSPKDKAISRTIAKRLQGDGLRVWFDDWEIRPGDSIPAKIEQGLEHSRVLVLCMSANAFGSDWAQLEASTFRFRDPLDKERRFILLRLDDAPIKGSLAQFLYISWRAEDCEQEYAKLLEACREPTQPPVAEALTTHGQFEEKSIHLKYKSLIYAYAFSPDGKRALAGADDHTVRLWDMETEHCLCVLEGHTSRVRTVAWSADQRHVLSGSWDNTVRLWDVETGCLCLLEGHMSPVLSVAWSADGRRAFSGDENGGIRVWNLSEFVTEAQAPKVIAPALPPASDQVQYTNAKVLLVGESGAGKTGLSTRLASNNWQPSDSTVGAWATQWELPVSSGDGVEREIWLWDFGGQADQRLIHQLYMDETALAVLVFDGQKEDLFETLGQWDRDLTRASPQAFAKLLAAGRVDMGGLRVSRNQIEAFAKERGYTQFLETSAKTNLGCEELKYAILDSIRWEDIPWRSSPLLFKRLKEEIVRLKDAGRVLMRFNELRETLQMRLSGEVVRFTDEELKAVMSLLAGPDVVWELKFGSWVLLQPERINAYAQAVIQAMRADEYERGCLLEERVLNGDLTYHSSIERLEADEERFVLLAMHQTLVERGLCLREHTDEGPLLVFPSYYRRERPELVGHPAVLVSYRFNGFLDDIYATLVVQLHHTRPFQQDQLWRYAADFKTLTGKQLGMKLTRRAEGAGELEVYFDPTIAMEEKIIFSKYVHEHLLQKAHEVVRLRHYVCPHCGTPVGNREVAMKRLEAWLEKNAVATGTTSLLKGRRGKSQKPTIICAECEKRVPLWDEMEEYFASPETKQQVRELEKQSAMVLDNESKERSLVGDVISTVTLAGQISREFSVSDHGIDMEIEFKSDTGEATGRKVYLQLKSGDLHLSKLKRDGAEIFTIKDARHARYWMAQARFPCCW
jgi:small GTP-binding protein